MHSELNNNHDLKMSKISAQPSHAHEGAFLDRETGWGPHGLDIEGNQNMWASCGRNGACEVPEGGRLTYYLGAVQAWGRSARDVCVRGTEVSL
jgi:hypothetical protein